MLDIQPNGTYVICDICSRKTEQIYYTHYIPTCKKEFNFCVKCNTEFLLEKVPEFIPYTQSAKYKLKKVEASHGRSE